MTKKKAEKVRVVPKSIVSGLVDPDLLITKPHSTAVLKYNRLGFSVKTSGQEMVAVLDFQKPVALNEATAVVSDSLSICALDNLLRKMGYGSYSITPVGYTADWTYFLPDSVTLLGPNSLSYGFSFPLIILPVTNALYSWFEAESILDIRESPEFDKAVIRYLHIKPVLARLPALKKKSDEFYFASFEMEDPAVAEDLDKNRIRLYSEIGLTSKEWVDIYAYSLYMSDVFKDIVENLPSNDVLTPFGLLRDKVFKDPYTGKTTYEPVWWRCIPDGIQVETDDLNDMVVFSAKDVENMA